MTFCLQALDDFTARYPQSSWSGAAAKSMKFPELEHFLAKYQNPKEADAMTRLQSDLDETKIILVHAFHSYPGRISLADWC